MWLSFAPQAGHEQAGRRPALTLSPEEYNEKTSWRSSVRLRHESRDTPLKSLPPATSSVSGVVLADQVKSLDWRARRARFESQAPRQVVGEALEKINVLLE